VSAPETAAAGAPAAGEHEEDVVTKRKLIGRIVSDRMTKTVVVEVVRFKREAMYKKYIRVRKRYKAHDEKSEYKLGDRVEIIEHRPFSKHKRWLVTRLIDRPAQELVARPAAEGEEGAAS
jgi:small subunit ribosomal protein S17